MIPYHDLDSYDQDLASVDPGLGSIDHDKRKQIGVIEK